MLRNYIERVFAVLKKRFAILSKMTAYSIRKQAKIVLCCFLLHNYCRMTRDGDDEDEMDADMQYMRNMADYDAERINYENANRHEADPDQEDAIAWRNGIAQSMWEDYLLELERRGL